VFEPSQDSGAGERSGSVGMVTPSRPSCAICGSWGRDIGVVESQMNGRQFHLAHCDQCKFSWVTDPRTDFANIYSDDYYAGKGADKHVNYVFDACHCDETAQAYEWRGILEYVSTLTALREDIRWLDYGCGSGGLVNYLRTRGFLNAVGFEQGWALPLLDRLRVPHIGPADIDAHAATFDVVTATEVLEHSVAPLQDLHAARLLLRPGGLLFLTTGNSRPFRGRMASWRYVNPDVHVSFFEPETLSHALRLTGFRPAFPGFGPGWPCIYRAKLHRVFRVRRRHAAAAIVPWPLLSRVLERRYQLARQPVGWAV
jgi:SAM-dependent methyltransferase